VQEKTKELEKVVKADVFLDAVPRKSMSHKGRFLSEDYITPHKNNPLKNPDPLKFLKVLPQVIFDFSFILQNSKVLPSLTADKKLILFSLIIQDFGLGAKTNVGYGQFLDENISQKKSTIKKGNASNATINESELIQETEEDKRIINRAELQCKVIKKGKKYYFFQFDWGDKIIFKKKITKINEELKVGDTVIITIASNYKISKDVIFNKDVDIIKNE